MRTLEPDGNPPPAAAKPDFIGRSAARWLRTGWRATILVFFAAVSVHGPSIAFGFIGLDDQDVVVDDQPFLSRPLNLLRIFTRSYMHVVDAQHAYYRPIVTASYWLDAQWGGARPAGYHMTNVLLHGFASVLFLALLRLFGLGRAASWGALVFAVHPALGADVAWIAGRNDSLLAIFVLAAWLWLPVDLRSATWPRRLTHGAFFGLALLTKETAIVAPLVWAVHVALFEPNARAPSQRWRALAVGWAIAIAARVAISPAAARALALPTARGVWASLRLLATGFGALVFPVNPSLLEVAQDAPVWPSIVALCVLAAALRWLPDVRARVVTLGAVAFVLFLAPTFTSGAAIVLSSRLYLPACGAILAASEIVRALGLRYSRHAMASFSVVTLGALALLTLAYETTFRGPRPFARYEVEAMPHSAMAHFCLGRSYQMDRPDRALAEYRLALSLGSVEVVHNNIAVLAMARGDWFDAENELRSELAVNPRYARAYRNLGIVLEREGRPAEARAAELQANALEEDVQLR